MTQIELKRKIENTREASECSYSTGSMTMAAGYWISVSFWTV